METNQRPRMESTGSGSVHPLYIPVGTGGFRPLIVCRAALCLEVASKPKLYSHFRESHSETLCEQMTLTSSFIHMLNLLDVFYTSGSSLQLYQTMQMFLGEVSAPQYEVFQRLLVRAMSRLEWHARSFNERRKADTKCTNTRPHLT